MRLHCICLILYLFCFLLATSEEESQKQQQSFSDKMLSMVSKFSKFNELEPKVACKRLKKKFHVIPGVSWGSLPMELQK
jgi:hypothetical protein